MKHVALALEQVQEWEDKFRTICVIRVKNGFMEVFLENELG